MTRSPARESRLSAPLHTSKKRLECTVYAAKWIAHDVACHPLKRRILTELGQFVLLIAV